MEELDEIRQKYESGHLEPIRRDLELFLQVHRTDIQRFREEEGLADDAAITAYILELRSINHEAEVREQVEEILKEKWIRGIQQGRPPDELEVVLDWARRYGAGWRTHRVTTILYVFDREKERYLSIFRDGG
jgi:hypothetical protein